jgi:hypothetical protein
MWGDIIRRAVADSLYKVQFFASDLDDDQRLLRITLAEDVEQPDALTIAGLTDRAHRPNAMPTTKLPFKPLDWPVRRDGLLFAWRTADEPITIVRDDGSRHPPVLQDRGNARRNAHQAMVLSDGAVIVDQADANLRPELTRAAAITVEALITTDSLEQAGPARIVSYSTDSVSRNFTLGQHKDKLVFRLRTPATGGNGTNPQSTIGSITPGRPTHVVVAYTPGRIRAWIDGDKTLDSRQVTGDFANWEPQTLLFGDELRGDRDWHGTLEHIAIYARALDEPEVRANYAQVDAHRAARPGIDRVRVESELVAASSFPRLDALGTYRKALVVHEWQQVTDDPNPRRFRVAHWAYLDRKPQSIRNAKLGTRRTLTLERFDDNPQLEQLLRFDTLPIDPDAKIHFDTNP